MTAGPTDPPSLPSALFVWRSGRGGLYRLVAHVLIRLLILLPLPPQLQMGALLFPVSLLWPLVTAQPAEAVKEGPAETTAEVLLARSFPLSDGLCGVSPRRWDLVLALRTDIVMSGNTAIVAIGGGKAVLVDVTNPLAPNKVGLMEGVGTRLALTDSNLLVSTYRTYLGNVNNPLQGLHVAALGNLALVEFDPARIVVGESGYETAESFKLKYRVIPPTFEVRASKIQWRIFEATQSEVNAPMTDGVGALDYPLGHNIPRSGTVLARPRLVINAGEADEILGPVKAWKTEKAEVRFEVDQDPVRVTANEPQALATATSAEWRRRYEGASVESPATKRTVSWQASPPPAVATPAQVMEDAGVFHTAFRTDTRAGAQHEVRALVGDVVLGRAQVEVEPGPAETVTLTADKTSIPADGATEVVVTLDAKDIAGNPVMDGTGIEWELDADGDLVEFDRTTVGGGATARYRAGLHDTGPLTITARVDDKEGQLELEQAPVTISVSVSRTAVAGFEEAFEVEAELSSSAGPVSDAAPFGWASTVGRLAPQGSLAAGRARAHWTPVRYAYMERIHVQGQLGPWTGEQVVDWALPPPPGAMATRVATAGPLSIVSPLAVAGDLTADGVYSIALLDGTSAVVPVKATTRYQIVGLQPGAHVTLQVGSSLNPNTAPVVHYNGEGYQAGEAVDDVTGVHPGSSNAGVTPISDGYPGRGFHFDGAGVISVLHHPDFEFTDAFLVQTAVRPPTDSASQTLLEKAGEYRLSLDRSSGVLRARFSVTTAGGEASVVSSQPVPEGAWTVVSGRYQSGRLWIGVGQSEDSAPLQGAPQHGNAALVIGSALVGDLDEIRIFDLVRAPMMLFANGEATLSFVADATGSFSTEVRSTGALGLGAGANSSQGSPTAPLGQQGAAPGEESYLSYALNEIVAFIEDEGVASRNVFLSVPARQLALNVKLIQGIFGTTVRESDLPVIAGHVLVFAASIVSVFPCGVCQVLLIPLSIIDVVTLVDHGVSRMPSGWDALTVLSLLQVVRPYARGARLTAQLNRTEEIAQGVARLGSTKAARGTARTLTNALKELVEHPDIPTKLKAILESPLDEEAKAIVVKLLGRGGRVSTQMARLDGVLQKTDDIKKTLLAVEKIAQELGDARYRKVLWLAWRATERGHELSTKAIEALGKVEKVARAQAGSSIDASRRIARLMESGVDGVGPKAILEMLDNVLGDVGTNGEKAIPGIYNLIRNLGNPYRWNGRFIAAEGALGELTAINYYIARQAKVVQVQGYQSIVEWAIQTVTGSTRGRARWTDLIVEIAGAKYLVEVKRWKVFHGATDTAFLDAVDQMRRDLVLFTKTPTEKIQWSFLLGVGPKGLKPGDIPKLGHQFADALDKPALREALLEVFRTRGLTQDAAKALVETTVKEFKDALRQGRVLQGI